MGFNNNPACRFIYILPLVLCFIAGDAAAADWDTPLDGNIIVPERRRFELIIFKGGTSAEERDWNDDSNKLWSLPLKNVKGVAESDMDFYNNLWRADFSINDVKRVIYEDKIHLVVTGNGGDAVAMYDYETKTCIYWSQTTGDGPHDVDFIPKGSGFLVVADPGTEDYLDLYDISENNKGCIIDSRVKHKGVHSVHWDAKQEKIWAWGGGDDQLKLYDVVMTDGVPGLEEVGHFKVDIDYTPGTGHGGAPMLDDGQRYLILAGNDGIARFNTESHEWDVFQPDTREWYDNPKGVSYNPETGETITAKATDEIYSLDPDVGPRQLDNSQFYKARWWFHNEFSYPRPEQVSIRRHSSRQLFTFTQSGSQIRMKVQNSEELPINLLLTDSRGRFLVKRNISNPSGNLIDLSAGDYPAGTYFLSARAGPVKQTESFFLP